MSVTLQILTEPIGSQLTATIATDESAEKNDFPIFITGTGNFTLEADDIDLTDDYSIQSFEGSGCTYRAVIRPLETAGVLSVSIAENAVPEGNPAVSQDIRVSTSFPDTDSQDPTLLVDTNMTGTLGIAVTPTLILISGFVSGQLGVAKFQRNGTYTNEQLTVAPLSTWNSRLDYFNGDILFGKGGAFSRTFGRSRVADGSAVFQAPNATFWHGFGVAIVHCRLGYVGVTGADLEVIPYGSEGETTPDATEYTLPSAYTAIAHQDDILYFHFSSTGHHFRYAEIRDDDTIEIRRHLNISSSTLYRDLAVYRDTLYILGIQGEIYTLDIRPYRPMAKNTKTTIYPVFSNEGDTIDLMQYAPDAETIIFDTGFDKPDYLSVNATNGLVITSDAVTETTPVLVRLRGINRIDSQPLSFYLVIQSAESPVWRDVDSLSMPANSTYNLHQIVDAESIAFESGATQPTGSSLADGIFTIGTVGSAAHFTATKDGLTTDKTLQINVIQASTPANFSDIFRYTVLIKEIDVTADLLKTTPIQVSKSSDNIELTRYRTDSVSIALNNANDRYDPDADDNFWDENSLNPGGYQEDIKVYLENFIGGAWVSHLLFSGIIEKQAEAVSTVQVNLTAVDISVNLQRSVISDFGQQTKWDMLRKFSDEDSFEGVYVPEGSLVPIQPKTAAAYHDRTQLTRSSLQLPTHGPKLLNTMYVSESDVRVSGGFFEEGLPVAKFKTYPRYSDIVSLLNLLSIASTVYNIEIEVPEVTLGGPTVFNQGSVPFATEATRITRLPMDWVYDATNERTLMLLSNPESHIADLLVHLDIARRSYRTLHAFDKDVKVHRIARRNATNYYILTSRGITQDRSAQTLPRQSDSTAYAYDAIAEGSGIKIYHYNASTGALTEHVAEDNARPAQLGVHYHTGFENALYIDEFEGILPHDRGAFKWYSGNLYYRYAKDSEFGVARVNTSGTTSEMIDQAKGDYHNHLNFAFDITSTGTIYFVYATGDADESTLTIKRRTSDGTENTILTDTQDLEDLNDLDEGGGGYLGCHEVLFHSNYLYLLCPIQRVDADDSDPPVYTRSREKAAGMILYRCDVTAATPSLTVIEKWDFVHQSGCNLVVHDGNAHYIEHPVSASQFKPINPDLDSYNESMGYNLLSESLGALKKINTDGTVEDLGNLWYAGNRAYNQALTRALSIDGELHITMGYGDPRELLKYNSLASKADNFVHIIYGKKLRFLPPNFIPTRNIYREITDIARKIGATVSFNNNLISVKDRRKPRAKVNGNLVTADAVSVAFEATTRTFPGAGYLKINSEFLAYTGISSGSFTGVTRGCVGDNGGNPRRCERYSVRRRAPVVRRHSGHQQKHRHDAIFKQDCRR